GIALVTPGGASTIMLGSRFGRLSLPFADCTTTRSGDVSSLPARSTQAVASSGSVSCTAGARWAGVKTRVPRISTMAWLPRSTAAARAVPPALEDAVGDGERERAGVGGARLDAAADVVVELAERQLDIERGDV